MTMIKIESINDMIRHNLKIAVRNLLKYKLQTAISVLSIAIGIVTLAFAHSVMERVTLPAIYHQPYYDRTYRALLKPLNPDADDKRVPINKDFVRALKRDGGLKHAERIALRSVGGFDYKMDFHLCDSSVHRKSGLCRVIDPEYIDIQGVRSAITGEKIKRLGVGEAIICKTQAELLFGDKNPIGAVQTRVSNAIPVPFTIVDVCEDFSQYDFRLFSQIIYISLGEVEGERWDFEFADISTDISIVMKEGSTEQLLLSELNERIKPFNIKASLMRETDREDVKEVFAINPIVYLISSLILIAAIIGFLRMQVQLFWSRRREVSLRIVNGATRWRLFCLFFTEVLITITLSVVTAMLMGGWIERYLYTMFGEETKFVIRHLSQYSCWIGALLLVICGITIRIALARICKSGQGLQASMRQSRTHIFRNTMLGVQIAISIAFVCSTFTALNWADKMFYCFHVPEDENRYKETLFLDLRDADNPRQILREIEQSPNLGQIIPHEEAYIPIGNVADNPDALSANHGVSSYHFLCAKDTSLLSFYNLKPHWLNKQKDNCACVILNESLYNQFMELGLIDDGTLSIQDGYEIDWSSHYRVVPIAGTIPHVPYNDDNISIYINTNAVFSLGYALVPKPGKHASLVNEIEEIIRRIETYESSDIVKNITRGLGVVSMIRSMRTVAMILGMVSVIVCAMGVYSAIALDTRSRKKEVAIRKAHGALSRDIYRLFGRIYIILVIAALLIAIPGALLFHRMMNFILPESARGTLSPIMPCLAGSLAVVAMIALIVGWHIRKVMRVECEELIAKE